MAVADMHTTAPHPTPALAEADRIMVVCNACRYCEGLCAVFPAMEMRRIFADGDLDYLANLCHNCGACYYDCQFSPPHEFDVNVPRALARVRGESYQRYAWPRAFSAMFDRNGLAIALAAALSVAAFILGFVASLDPAVLLGVHIGPGAFYRLMPHETMVWLFGIVFLYALVAMTMSARAFWRETETAKGLSLGPAALWQATRDACRLRYLDGGNAGCMNENEQAKDTRKIYHHATFYGFLLCFAATAIATIYHYVLGLEAPYGWFDLPVVLGTLGGIGLVVGPLGLLIADLRREPLLQDKSRSGADLAFVLMLLATGATGLLLLGLRSTILMGPLLALHLGFVFAFFLTMPYGKFVHGIYRFLALVRYAAEVRSRGGH